MHTSWPVSLAWPTWSNKPVILEVPTFSLVRCFTGGVFSHHLSKGTLVMNRWMLTWHRSLGSLLGTFSAQRGLALGRRVFLLQMRQQ